MNKLKTAFYILAFVILCNSLLSQTQAEMNKEAIKSYEKSDLELNNLYKKLINSIEGNSKTFFIQAQRNWIAFKEQQCKFEASIYDGGSIQPLIKFDCLDRITKSRISELKEIIDESLPK
jgi:uncharacterized protein YecT (DUF1311 family)